MLGLGLGVGAIAVLRDGGGEPAQEVGDRLVVQGSVIEPLVAGQPDGALGQPAPVLRGETLGGEAITTESGRPRMLVFFAHWCEPCEIELGLIVRLAGEDVLDGIDVIGVSTSAAPERRNHPPSEWLRREEWPFPTVASANTNTLANGVNVENENANVNDLEQNQAAVQSQQSEQVVISVIDFGFNGNG